MASALRTLEQQRAREAWKCIERAKKENWAGDYRTIVTKAPSLILTNGVGQTLAYLRSKSDRPHFNRLYEDLSAWLINRTGIKDGRDLLEWVVNVASSQEYRRATTEALAFLQWMKRFAEAYLPKGGEA